MSADNVLLRAIATLPAGSHVSVDHVREVLDAAGLTSAERSGAFRSMCAEGYLRPVVFLVDGEWLTVSIRTRHEAGKGRKVDLYTRTRKRVPQSQVAA